MARRANEEQRISWLRRAGCLFLLIGWGAGAIYGRTPLAAFSIVGGAMVLFDTFRTTRQSIR